MKQMKFSQTLGALLIMSASLFVLAGCQKEEGPLEKAGKQVDQAAENFGQAIDGAAEKAGEQIEKAGEQVQDAAKDKP